MTTDILRGGLLVSNCTDYRVRKPSPKEEEESISEINSKSCIMRSQTSPPPPPPAPARQAPPQQHIRAKLRSQLLSSHRRSAAASGPVVARHENSQRGSPSSDSSSASEPSSSVPPPTPKRRSSYRGHRVKAPSPVRRTPSPSCPDDGWETRVDKAKRCRLYLLHKCGPNAFVVSGNRESRYQVRIGPQTCTCGRPSPCVHILFVMLRVFQKNDGDPMLYAKMLKNYEVEALFRRYEARKRARLNRRSSEASNGHGSPDGSTSGVGNGNSNRSSVGSVGQISGNPASEDAEEEDDEVCSICLLPMLEREILSRCEMGCGNDFHQQCLRVWAAECDNRDEDFTCPLCRCSFASSASRSSSSSKVSSSAVVKPHVKQWMECFGEVVAADLSSKQWDLRESALKTVTQLAVQELARECLGTLGDCAVMDISLERCPLVLAALEVINTLIEDPVYKVLVASLRALREILGYMPCPTSSCQSKLRRLLTVHLNSLLARCAPSSNSSQQRFSDLALSALVELAKGQKGELAVGRELRHGQPALASRGLGGLNYMLCFLLETRETMLSARLVVLERFMRQFCMDVEQLREIVLYAHRALQAGRQARRVFLSAARKALKTRDAKLARLVNHLVSHIEDGHLRGRIAEKLRATDLTNGIVRHTPEPAYDNETSVVGTEDTSTATSVTVADSTGQTHSTATTHHTDHRLDGIRASKEFCSQLALDQVVPSTVDPMVLPKESCDGGKEGIGGGICGVAGSGRGVEEEGAVVSAQRAEDALWALRAALRRSEKQEGLPLVPILCSGVNQQVDLSEESGPLSADYMEGADWIRGPLLGTGAFSNCYQARDKATGTLMAVKQISVVRSVASEEQRVMEAVLSEIQMMLGLDHPNVARLLGASLTPNSHVNLFVEWMPGGSVASLLARYGPFSEGVIASYTLQILRALRYLHAHQIIHRDLKGANVLVDSSGHQIRVSDFGAAARLATQMTGAGEFQGQMLGTIAFMAPEVLRGESYGRSCDMWSLGCVCIEMLTTKPPWHANAFSNHLALIFKIATSTEPPPIPDNVSPELRAFVNRCFATNPKDRPSSSQLMLDRFLERFREDSPEPSLHSHHPLALMQTPQRRCSTGRCSITSGSASSEKVGHNTRC